MTKDLMVLYYLLFINIFGFILILIDKRKSIKGKWRIREKNFFIFAILGAGIGEYISMILYRHKTKHKSFTIGIPIITVAFYLLMLYLLYFLWEFHKIKLLARSILNILRKMSCNIRFLTDKNIIFLNYELMTE